MDATKQNQQSKEEKAIPAAPIQELIEPGKLRVIKRNGSVVNFDATKNRSSYNKSISSDAYKRSCSFVQRPTKS